jgi:hypothetical protein
MVQREGRTRQTQHLCRKYSSLSLGMPVTPLPPFTNHAAGYTIQLACVKSALLTAFATTRYSCLTNKFLDSEVIAYFTRSTIAA